MKVREIEEWIGETFEDMGLEEYVEELELEEEELELEEEEQENL